MYASPAPAASGAPIRMSEYPFACTSPAQLTDVPALSPADTPTILNPSVPFIVDTSITELLPLLPNTAYTPPVSLETPGAPKTTSDTWSPLMSPPETDQPARSPGEPPPSHKDDSRSTTGVKVPPVKSATGRASPMLPAKWPRDAPSPRPSCPNPFPPQHLTLESSRTAHV